MSQTLIEAISERTFSVPEYLELVNELISPLSVAVEGEVTDLKVLREWVFFSLKDAESESILRCGLHVGVYRRIGVSLDEGMAVKVTGYGKLSPKTGNFGFWVKTIEPIGEGALRRAYELLLEKLKSEGLFARKRVIPSFITRIGVISSRDGVVLQDLRKNLLLRGVHIDFLHSGVEGAGSAEEIRTAIEQFNRMSNPPDVLVLIRGGGSLESLQGFNNEAVCRALFACPVPTLVGIGHDVDAPIATLVADYSASTPTAVAHVINSSWDPLTRALPEYSRAMREGVSRCIDAYTHRVALGSRALTSALASLQHRTHFGIERYTDALRRFCERLDECGTRARDAHRASNTAFSQVLERMEERVESLVRLLNASDPSRALARGYSLVYSERSLVRSVSEVAVGAELSMRVTDGTITSTVTSRTHD